MLWRPRFFGRCLFPGEGGRIDGRNIPSCDGPGLYRSNRTLCRFGGQAYDRTALFAMREEIVAATQAYRACYPEAYRCIRGAVESRRRGSTPLHTEETLAKAEKRASGILARELKTTRTQPGKQHSPFFWAAPLVWDVCCWRIRFLLCVSEGMKFGMIALCPAFFYTLWNGNFWRVGMM